MEDKIKINILEILKKCPIGTKLYSPICGECELDRILDNTFNVASGKTIFTFLHDGRYSLLGECCIFPSKENRDWNKFQNFNTYKNGDIIYFITKCNNEYIIIFKNIKDGYVLPYIDLLNKTGSLYKNSYLDFYDIKEHRLATEEEKEILFEQIENSGFKWNEQTKTLDKLIKDKFDISTLKPFESKVLVRDNKKHFWKPAIFGGYIKDCSDDYKYIVMGETFFKYLIPYKNNEHLLCTNNDCDEYYKTW